MIHPVLIDGQWRSASSTGSFAAKNPATGETLVDEYPHSDWADVDEALKAAEDAFQSLRTVDPSAIATFLEIYANLIEQNRERLVTAANEETALPKSPRLNDVELPRTTNQLRAAAKAAREQSWCDPIIDTAANLRSVRAPIGPVAIFGPNNFPFAFNGISGGDFAAAIACGCPVIAKAHPNHPTTTRLLAQLALDAVKTAELPPATVQLLYSVDGLRLVSDPRIGATAFTGSRAGGLALKQAADAVGKPFFGELSSINPVIILPGALSSRGGDIATQLVGSCLMGAGQFCTSPGLVVLFDGADAQAFVESVTAQFSAAPNGTLLSEAVQHGLARSIDHLIVAGATLLVGGLPDDSAGYRFHNTVLYVEGTQYLHHPRELQAEAFGNSTLIVVAKDVSEVTAILRTLEGNLTGSIYSDASDDADYNVIEPILRQRVGRLINDKMPTGVAVSPAQNHGGPFPASTHPGATSVGIPGAISRFTVLHCYDNVRDDRLPPILRSTKIA